MERDSIYLQEIREFCEKVISFVSGVDYKQFVADEKLQFAVIKLIENIGEASKRLSEKARVEQKGVDWKKAMAMRDRLVHDYMDVDLQIVYDVAVREVPLLLKCLRSIR